MATAENEGGLARVVHFSTRVKNWLLVAIVERAAIICGHVLILNKRG